MKPAPSTSAVQKKGHVCPPSDATHPRDRWETAFVYAFITKFTNTKVKTEGFEAPEDLENALLSPTQHPILVSILTRFVLNLKPQTRNLSADQLAATVSSILQEHMKTSERTVFWNDSLKMNTDPLQDIQGGFWGADWDVKLQVLRQLVEFQLSHHGETRETIDKAWGVVNNKHRKKEGNAVLPEAQDPQSVEQLSTVPIGQDVKRQRYWVLDDSPRLYISTNPWKITASFRTIATNKLEYLKVIEGLKANAPADPPAGTKRLKTETQHLHLITELEKRLERIDAEVVRVQKIRKKIEARELLMAQAEVRETRTRRRTRRPDYVYQDTETEDDHDEYVYQEEDYESGSNGVGSSRGRIGSRRSQRSSVVNANGKRPSNASDYPEWRGERRSSRLGTYPETLLESQPTKRARTDESSVDQATRENEPTEKKNGAAAVKQGEVAVEQIAGKKKSKFWFYAVEPLPGSLATGTHSDVHPPNTNGTGPMDSNQQQEHQENHRENGNNTQNGSVAPIVNYADVSPGYKFEEQAARTLSTTPA